MNTTKPACPKCGAALPANSPAGLCAPCLMAMNMATPTVLPEDVGGSPAEGKPPPPAPEDIARHFPGFDIIECLGRGGMGVVYKARQKSLNRLVALKILAPEREQDAAFAQRFAVEAGTLARLNHPGIVTIYDFGQADGLFYFVMEFVDGVSLRQLLTNGRVAPREALAIVPEICDALQYAHDQGIVHRDIKPENILLDRRGRVKVADFGLAKLGRGTQQPVTPSDVERVAAGPGEGAGSPVFTDAGKIMGTPQYMAPEQAEKPGEVDHRADIYALGVVFYQMLTGELPGKRIEPPSRKVQIDVRLDEVVMRALEKDPGRRYSQASVFKTQIETIAGTSPGPAPVSRSEWPRLSRMALVGACWSLFPLLAVLFRLVLRNEGGQDLTILGFVLAATLVPLGAAAPFGTTILGGIAARQIRRSNGRLYGLGLAVFDGLLFPLLVCDAALLGLSSIAWDLLCGPIGADASAGARLLFLLTILVAISAMILLDVYVIRVVWRAVNRQPESLPSAESDRQPSPKGYPYKPFPTAAALLGLVCVLSIAGWNIWQSMGDVWTLAVTGRAMNATARRPVPGGRVTEGRNSYPTIQAAIDAAKPGAVIYIGAGVYREALEVRKPLTLSGPGWESATVGPPTNANTLAELPPTLRVEGAKGVEIRGLKFTQVAPDLTGQPRATCVVNFTNSNVRLRDCAVLGARWDGFRITGDTEAEITNCLIASVRVSGVSVWQHDCPRLPTVRITHSEIRNCLWGVYIRGRGEGVTVEHCRLADSAWAGISCLGASPRLEHNLLLDHRRDGMFLTNSSATVCQNVFSQCGSAAISSTGTATDSLENNTLVGNPGPGVLVAGKATPLVRNNIFCDDAGAIQPDGTRAEASKPFAAWAANLGPNLVWNCGSTNAPTALAGNEIALAPQFVDTAHLNYRLAAGFTTPKGVMGASGVPEAQSPWPLQAEEKLWGPLAGNPDSRAGSGTRPADATTGKPDPSAMSYQAAFRELYETCGKQYPCFQMKGINWKAVGAELSPRAVKVESDKEFALLCMELIARLEDTHAAVLPGTAPLPELDVPQWAPDFVCLEDDRGEPVVYALTRGGKAEQAGVKRGMRLLKVNGVPARERLAGFVRFMTKYQGFSSQRAAQLEGVRFFLMEKERGARMAFEMDDAAGSYHFDLTADDKFGYYPRLPVPIEGIVDNGTVSWTRLMDDIGFIYVRRMRDDLEARLDAAVAALKGVRGLIVDVRGNSGGGFNADTALVNFMLDRAEFQPDRPRYQGPMALLTDALCNSAGEGWASGLIATKRARTFGQATAGASSAKETIPVKNGLYQVRLPIKPYNGYLDRPIERRGLEPDVPLMPNARDLAARRDTVLEAAKAWLLSSASETPKAK